MVFASMEGCARDTQAMIRIKTTPQASMQSVTLGDTLDRFTVHADPSAGRYRAHYAFVSSAWVRGRCVVLHTSRVHNAEALSFIAALISHIKATRKVTGVGNRAVADIFSQFPLRGMQSDLCENLEGTTLTDYNVCQRGHRSGYNGPLDLAALGTIGPQIDDEDLVFFHSLLSVAQTL